MKILILDNHNHEGLYTALNQYNITLEHRNYIGAIDINESEYSLVILCPSSKKHLAELFKTISFSHSNIVVLFNEADAKFIVYCSKHGCKDVIRFPYLPDAVAKRLKCLIESLSANEASIVVSHKDNFLNFSVDKYIQIEIQRSNRGKTPLSFLAVEVAIPMTNSGSVINILRYNLRNTDLVNVYENYILVMLPYCNKTDALFLKLKLDKCLFSFNANIFCITKDHYYEESMPNEKDMLLDILEEGLKKPTFKSI
jgi:hypothetical protein